MLNLCMLVLRSEYVGLNLTLSLVQYLLGQLSSARRMHAKKMTHLGGVRSVDSCSSFKMLISEPAN